MYPRPCDYLFPTNTAAEYVIGFITVEKRPAFIAHNRPGIRTKINGMSCKGESRPNSEVHDTKNGPEEAVYETT
jgi:hypothetical protein